ncbi:SEL1-like repeat protein [Oxalobacteraceae sp. CFBP 8755]|nr:SEL1-like repeat protein [Oxalobacteraceae sp. CFBP 8753]MBD8632089.1 SEL1-like repeat protein [Oxalobacteraceae sp. CFBP 8755]
MNDLEFSQRLSTRIGELYREAKRSRHTFPKHTLIQTRAIARLACDLLGREMEGTWPSDLDKKIEALYRGRRINPHTRSLLSQLRVWGNAAAHPEISLTDDKQLLALGSSALANTLELFEIVFRDYYQGATIPQYEIVDENPDEIKELSYRALVEGSSSDQFQLASFLLDDLERKVKRLVEDPDTIGDRFNEQQSLNAQRERAVDLLGYASNAGFVPAKYQFGLALVERVRGKDMVAKGLSLIAQACQDGYTDALAWCGQASLYGQHHYEIDYEIARSYLERAAGDDHPTALTLLSRMYRLGQGVDLNVSVAASLTMRAAEAGFPTAQYDAAVALFEGTGVPADAAAALRWLSKAADAGFPPAQLATATLIRRGEIEGTRADVQRLLTAAMSSLNLARFDLADAFLEAEDFWHISQAAYLIQECFSAALNEDDRELAERCRSVSPSVVKRLEAMLRTVNDADLKELLMVRFMFNERGFPYPDRMERAKLFLDSAVALSNAKGRDHREELRLTVLLESGMVASTRVPLARKSHRAKFLAEAPKIRPAELGRNDPCHCGSAKKFKRCHGL